MPTNKRLPDTEVVLPATGSRRDQIVAAAAALFSVKGYHGTTMEDIGKAVGLLKGSLYAHVASKEELLLEIISTADRVFLTALAPLGKSSEPPAVKLQLALRAHMRTAFELGPVAGTYLLEWRHLTGKPALWVLEARERYVAIWQQILADGIADGSFRADLDPYLASWLAAAALSYAQQQPPPGSPMDHAEQADRICMLLLEGYLQAQAPLTR